ncbi:MAG: hypothetical protein ACREAU_00965 [Nitrosopumilaceae archaeon]
MDKKREDDVVVSATLGVSHDYVKGTAKEVADIIPLIPVKVPEEQLSDKELLELLKEKIATIGEKELRKLLDENSPKDIPRVELRGALYDPEKGIQIELDWNPEFITLLRKKGVPGITEDEIVRRWLAYLSREILHEMEEAAETDSTYE